MYKLCVREIYYTSVPVKGMGSNPVNAAPSHVTAF